MHRGRQPSALRPDVATTRPVRVVARLCTVGLALLAAQALAQFKVVGPDGRVTYTDRPTVTEPGSRVSPMRAGTSVAASAPDGAPMLPLALRPVAARFPVTLYTSADCEPCVRARQLLRERGIPHAERSIGSEADVQALQRLTGGRTVPALAVGQQVLRGLLDADWQATLDLAGYPRTSQLPPGWPPPAARPLVATNADRVAAAVAGDPPARVAPPSFAPPPAVLPADRPTPTLRF
jgi:glutaredoxin